MPEICGVEVEVLTADGSTWVDIGGETMTPADVKALRPSADWTRTVVIGPYTLDEQSLARLQRFVKSGGRTEPEGDDPPPDPNVRATNLARRAAALLAEVATIQDGIGARENGEFARQVEKAAAGLAAALQAKPGC